jgi:hypothetical protein
MSEFTNEEIIQHRKDWVSALRSGKYTKTIGFLKTEKGHCCLGVACEVAGLSSVKNPSVSIDYYIFDDTKNKSFSILDEYMVDYLGLNNCTGLYSEDYTVVTSGVVYKHKGPTSLSIKNDSADLTFLQIADIIESEPEGLFRELV